jgi:hypothetical protein
MAVRPPSTKRSVPVTNAASADASKSPWLPHEKNFANFALLN